MPDYFIHLCILQVSYQRVARGTESVRVCAAARPAWPGTTAELLDPSSVPEFCSMLVPGAPATASIRALPGSTLGTFLLLSPADTRLQPQRESGSQGAQEGARGVAID